MSYIGVATTDQSLDSLKFTSVGSTQITGLYKIVQTIAPASVAANTTSEQTFSVVGVRPNDSIDINKASHQAGLGITNVRASANDVLAITFMNNTAAPIVPISEAYIIGGVR
jgi:hypothetical protein